MGQPVATVGRLPGPPPTVRRVIYILILIIPSRQKVLTLPRSVDHHFLMVSGIAGPGDASATRENAFFLTFFSLFSLILTYSHLFHLFSGFYKLCPQLL